MVSIRTDNLNISVNKKTLELYLEDFHPNVKERLYILFDDNFFSKGPKSFIYKMKKTIAMPAVGKKTKNYWLARGWNENESEEKRVKIKGNITSPMTSDFWIKKGFSLEEAHWKIKSQRKTNKEYWINKGFTEDQSIEKVREFQIDNSKKLKHKRTNPEFDKKYRMSNSVSLDYWLNKGYSEEDSLIKLKERQSTFSLEKCIKKYGEKEGKTIWDTRQKKWLSSLEKSNYNGRDGKDSKTINFFKNKFGNSWLENYILNIGFKERSKIYYLLSFTDYKEMINFLINDNKKYSYIIKIISNQIIGEYYNCTKEDLKNYLAQNYGVKPKKSFEYLKKLYPSNWISFAIEIGCYKDKEIIKELISFTSYEEMINYMIGKYSVTFIVQKLKNKILSHFFDTTFKKMFDYMTTKDIIINAKFGHMRHFNGHLCRSDGEFIISNFLKDNNINYEYEKRYPGTIKRCDFFLKEKGYYIEFTGMSKFIKKNNVYMQKKLFCEENKLNHFFSSEVEDIKNKIKEIYEIKNNIR